MKTTLIANIQKETQSILNSLHDLGRDLEECISEIQTAYLYNNSSPLEDCRAKVKNVKEHEVFLTEKISEIIKDNMELRKYISVPGHLSGIAKNIEKLADLIDRKNQDKILFSDKAINEIMFLLQRLSEMLRPAADMILARNKFLTRYVEESRTGIERRANEYADNHEERLICGECLPIASSLYLSLLDGIKSIAWHTNEITAKLGG